MVTTVYLIRHAQAEGNEKRIFQGHLDGPVSGMGRLQLEQLAEYAKELPIDAIVTSPLARAYETAEAVNLHHGLPIETDEGLLEINGGDWEGVPWARFPVDWPEENEHWEKRPWLFHAPNGESMPEVYERISNAVLSIVRSHPGKTIAVVSHGCAIRNLLTFAKGLPVEGIAKTGWCDNTAISKIEFDEGYRPSLIYENNADHLREETKTFAHQMWWKESEPKEETV